MSVQIAAGASFWFCISGFTANELKGRNGPRACCAVCSSIDGGPSTWSHQCPTLGPSVPTRPTQISIRLLLFYETQTGRTLHKCWPNLPPVCLWQMSEWHTNDVGVHSSSDLRKIKDVHIVLTRHSTQKNKTITSLSFFCGKRCSEKMSFLTIQYNESQ